MHFFLEIRPHFVTSVKLKLLLFPGNKQTVHVPFSQTHILWPNLAELGFLVDLLQYSSDITN